MGTIWGHLAGALVLLLAGAGCGAYALHGMTAASGPAVDFTMPDQSGRPYTLSAQQGDAVLLFFGYTNCPTECPTTLGDFKRVQADLGRDAGRAQFLMITVDPERDTPEVLQHYMEQFDGSFRALRGEGETLERVKQAYGAIGEAAEGPGVQAAVAMFHTTYMYLIGRSGRLETVYAYQTAPDIMAKDIRYLLRGGPAQG